MKDSLCKAFCEDLNVREVPSGLAVGTSFSGNGDDFIGFYITGPDRAGNYRIEDDGQTVSAIEASGADLGNDARYMAFQELLETYSASYDEDNGDLFVGDLTLDAVPSASLRFVALLIRAQDLLFMAAEKAESTFRADVLASMRKNMMDVEINERESVNPQMPEFVADIVLKKSGSPTTAVMLATTNQKVLEAIVMQTVAHYEKKIDLNVVALLETDKVVTQRTRQQAANRLAAMPIYRGDEDQAIKQIERQMRVIH